MKVKTMKRLLCILLAVTLLSSGFTALAAMPDTAVPYYTGTASIYANLSISSTGLASCSGNISLRSGYVANLTMKLQQYTSNGWTTIETWFTATQKGLSGSRYVTHGYYYRVVTSASVYTSSGGYVESPSVTSSSKYY